MTHLGRCPTAIWDLIRAKIIKLGLVSMMAVVGSGLIPRVTLAQQSNLSAKASTELPVVDSTALGTQMNVPWSQPVKIVDPFEGDSVGIFDRHYFYRNFLNNYNTRFEVVSLWQPDSIRLLLTYGERDCFLRNYSFSLSTPITRCVTATNPQNVNELFIKVGEQVFRLSGKNSTFKVSDELATALKNAPAENVGIRLVAEGGAEVDSVIGEKTVEAWKTIY
ncbi:hypothetical protein IQ238_13430 [Pleurocapsales cyanobacterium LEGE 06147]|nr:hypothetical protein [Pleurocapsales cyanobacterium LEGE 06147]